MKTTLLIMVAGIGTGIKQLESVDKPFGLGAVNSDLYGWYTLGRLFCLFIGGSYGTYGCCNNNLYPAQ